jgi:CheY-like chemotaxis protein
VQIVLKGLREGRYWMAAGQQTILVVEDDPAIRSFIVEALEGEGYTVAEAVDGAQAIDILEQPRPPLNHLCLVLLERVRDLV